MILDPKFYLRIWLRKHNLNEDQATNIWNWQIQELLTWQMFAIGPGQTYMTLIMTFDLDDDFGSWAQFSEIDSHNIIWNKPNNQHMDF